MIPFESFQFFLYLLPILLVSFILGLLKVNIRLRAIWFLVTTVLMVFLILRPATVLVQGLAFFLIQLVIIRFYLTIRQKHPANTINRYYYWALVLSLLPLAIVKLNPYFALKVWNTPIGFLGISYLTFRTVGTLIEIRDGLIKEVDFINFTVFVFFFPTLASGPIDRYRRFLNDLKEPPDKKTYAQMAATGLDLIFRGFLYKFIIAYLINRYWLQPLSTVFGFWPTFSYMYAYGLYLFFDFAGYSAFAIGTGHILGIKTPQNFDKPFISQNIKEFWTRWHMSLSFWFRDYIYMRFVLNSTKKKRFKNRYTASYIGYLLNFGIMGLWHGTQIQYILYGFYHAVLMIGFDLIERKNKDHRLWGKGPLWMLLSILITFHAVMFGFLVFSGRLTS